ncbi:TatD family hydrolase [Blattabacterium cuenoti]|uniref:TatD family hydrolase n=1 Tax=Blattabacterium cuenoti TaxID=1653831 RepID=UPI00163D2FC7|nr:TatD family hydrolase [Blattabacterium cuenoti]
MNIIDTHAHLYMKEFHNDIDHVINKSIKQGINKFFIPCINHSTIYGIIKLVDKYYDLCEAMIGLHPNYVNSDNFKGELNKINKWLNNYHFICIGEIGIDLYINKNFLYEQIYVFETQIKWAIHKKIPIVIHCRKAFDYVFNILSKKENYYIKGIFHCFSGTLEQAKKIIKLGFKLGIGGIITFKNNYIEKFLKKIDIKNIVLETDSPYLSPHPFRGKRNEPSNILIILKKLSEIYSLPERVIATITSNNVKELFS